MANYTICNLLMSPSWRRLMAYLLDLESVFRTPPSAPNRFQIVYLLVESSTIFKHSLE